MHQHFVSSGMAVGVVDALEVVQVKHDDHARCAVLGLLQRGIELLREGTPVRQPGQGIGGGQALQGLFAAAPLGDVAHDPQLAYALACRVHLNLLALERAAIGQLKHRGTRPGRLPVAQHLGRHALLQGLGR